MAWRRWLLAGLTGLAGCTAPAPRRDPLLLARELEAAGFRGRAVIVFGGGHVGGVSYNVTGASGFIEIEIVPGGSDADGNALVPDGHGGRGGGPGGQAETGAR